MRHQFGAATLMTVSVVEIVGYVGAMQTHISPAGLVFPGYAFSGVLAPWRSRQRPPPPAG
jgi:hypothetical protein